MNHLRKMFARVLVNGKTAEILANSRPDRPADYLGQVSIRYTRLRAG